MLRVVQEIIQETELCDCWRRAGVRKRIYNIMSHLRLSQSATSAFLRLGFFVFFFWAFNWNTCKPISLLLHLWLLLDVTKIRSCGPHLHFRVWFGSEVDFGLTSIFQCNPWISRSLWTHFLRRWDASVSCNASSSILYIEVVYGEFTLPLNFSLPTFLRESQNPPLRKWTGEDCFDSIYLFFPPKDRDFVSSYIKTFKILFVFSPRNRAFRFF